MAYFVSPHVKIRHAPKDLRAQARNFAERSTNAFTISLGMLFRSHSTKLRFGVPRGTRQFSSLAPPTLAESSQFVGGDAREKRTLCEKTLMAHFEYLTTHVS